MKEINFDYVVVGSGPAGSILSKFLSEKNCKIALIDRASDNAKGKKNFIFNPYINKCPNYYTPSFSDQIGGNSALWHKKIYLITKDEITKGQWPLKYSELLRYSKILAKKLQVNHRDVIYKNKSKNNIKYSKSRRAKFSNIYDYLKLATNPKVMTFKDSSPIKLYIKNDKKISGVEILNSNRNSKIKINISKAIIFCAGGLGNTFLIKNLIKEHRKNSGNFLCDHPHIQLINLDSKLAIYFKKISKVFLFSKEKKTKKKNKELNIYVSLKKYFAGVQLSTNVDPTLFLSRLYLKSNLFNFFGSPFRFLSKLINLIIFIVSISFKIYYKIFDYFGVPGKYSFEFFFSQEKNDFNNLKLNENSLDNFNLKKLDVNWKLSHNDLSIYNKLVRKFLNSSSLLSNKSFNLKNINKKVYVGLHPSCSNSMSSKKDSIVDKNLKIKNFKNLFICGSDVFPSNGFTNPTWTIMTLSIRLNYYLRKKFL